MKKTLLVFLFTIIAFWVSGESIWTGNAAVGGLSEFPGTSTHFRAASNSFPEGTKLRVSNPRNGESVDVTVIGRLESPGVFILIEKSAADSISLPTDHVLPVRVSPISDGDETGAIPAAVHDSVNTNDPDYNPVAGIEDTELRTVVIAEAEPELPAEEPDEDTTEMDATAAVPVYEVPEKGDKDEGDLEDDSLEGADKSKEDKSSPLEEVPSEETLTDVPAAEQEVILTYELVEDEAVPELEEKIEEAAPLDVPPPVITPLEEGIPGDAAAEPEAEIVEIPEEAEVEPEAEIVEIPEDDQSVVYFLSPSDLRPPELPESEDEDGEKESDEIDEVPVERLAVRVLEIDLAIAAPDDSRPYVQIASYRSLAILEDAAKRIRVQAPGYPLSYAESGSPEAPIYKLLIGPLRPAEKGAVLQTARSTLFPDAFPYKP